MASTINSIAPTPPNKMVLSSARTVISSKLPAPSTMPHSPPPFWLEATSTATYLINRLPTKTIYMQSPYQKLYDQSPSYLHLKTFGCLCYSWTAYTRNNKLDPKSFPYIFIGYSSDQKGYRCFDPHTSPHVRFHEHEFPMAQQPTTTPPPQISTIHNPLSPLFTPTFHPPTTSSTTPPNRPPTTNPTPPLPPPRKIDTHIQYQRRRPQSTTLPTSTLPPLLSLPSPPSPPPQANRPTSTHPMTTRSQTKTPTTSLNLSLTTPDPINYQQASSNPHWQQAMSTEIQG